MEHVPKSFAKVIRDFEEHHTYDCVFSYEESYGCIIGTHARHKNGIVAVMCLCEAVAYYKSLGLTLWDQMLKMYEKYGYYIEGQHSLVLKGAEKIKEMMTKVRNNSPKSFGKYTVTKFSDYQTSKTIDYTSNIEIDINQPKSNVLYFDLNDNAWCCVKPSGTEPKIKFYIGVKGNSLDDAKNKLELLKNDVLNSLS